MATFWTPKTIADLAAEQGVRLPQDIDALVGQGADLWESDEDFDRFLASIAGDASAGQRLSELVPPGKFPSVPAIPGACA